MLEARPAPSPGTITGYLLTAGLLLLDAGLVVLLLMEPITYFSFLWGTLLFFSLPALAFIVYWTVALTRARYVLGGRALTINWGPLHHVIPLRDVRAILSGTGESDVAHFRGVRWPGYQLGRAQMPNHPRLSGSIRIFATRPLSEQLLVQTRHSTYALTPADSERFRASLEALLAVEGEKGESQTEAPTSLMSTGWLAWPIWRDRSGQALLLLGLLLDALLFLALTILYPRLPARLPLQLDAASAVLRSGPAGRLFLLPVFGLLTWLLNASLGYFFYGRRREQVVAYLLWAGAVVVQVCAWVAIVILLWSPNP